MLIVGRTNHAMTAPKSMLKLVGRIRVEFDVEGFTEAGEHESALRTYLDSIRRRYPEATLEVTQRRTKKALGLTRTPGTAIPMERYRKG